MTRNAFYFCYATNLLAFLFCPSLAEEELRGVKQKKNMWIQRLGYTIFILKYPPFTKIFVFSFLNKTVNHDFPTPRGKGNSLFGRLWARRDSNPRHRGS